MNCVGAIHFEEGPGVSNMAGLLIEGPGPLFGASVRPMKFSW
jgi:hypothetical protein